MPGFSTRSRSRRQSVEQILLYPVEFLVAGDFLPLGIDDVEGVLRPRRHRVDNGAVDVELQFVQQVRDSVEQAHFVLRFDIDDCVASRNLIVECNARRLVVLSLAAAAIPTTAVLRYQLAGLEP